jgi:hypothetical protein
LIQACHIGKMIAAFGFCTSKNTGTARIGRRRWIGDGARVGWVRRIVWWVGGDVWFGTSVCGGWVFCPWRVDSLFAACLGQAKAQAQRDKYIHNPTKLHEYLPLRRPSREWLSGVCVAKYNKRRAISMLDCKRICHFLASPIWTKHFRIPTLVFECEDKQWSRGAV